MTASEPSQGLLGGESCTESGAWKLGLRKSVYPEHREHIQAEPGRKFRLSQWPGCRASTEQGGLLVHLDPGSHYLACLVEVMWSSRKNSVPSTD